MISKQTESPEEITRRLAEMLKEQEERDKWFWGFQHSTYSAAIERGKKDPRNCQKCGGHGFQSIFRSYEVKTKPMRGVPQLTGRRWIWELKPCGCLTRRTRVEKEEAMTEKEAKAVFR